MLYASGVVVSTSCEYSFGGEKSAGRIESRESREQYNV